MADVELLLKQIATAETESTSAFLLGKYEVSRLLSCSGQATVLLARDPELDRRVILKLYPDSLFEKDPGQVLREGRALARVRSPYVANCLGIERVGEYLFLIIEYVEGPTLAEQLQAGPLSAVQAIELVHKLASGIAAVHEAGLLHGDLKPSNVVMDSAGTPKLIDFGLAQDLRNDTPRAGFGTTAYMSPEVARSETEHVGVLTDVFGLGAILYHAVTGSPPFASENSAESLALAREGKIVAPRERVSVVAPLNRLILSCLATDTRDRPASARAVENTLIEMTRSRRRRRVFTGVAAAALAMVGMVWAIFGSRSDPPVNPQAEDTTERPLVSIRLTSLTQDRSWGPGKFVKCVEGEQLAVSVEALRDCSFVLLTHPVHEERLPTLSELQALYADGRQAFLMSRGQNRVCDLRMLPSRTKEERLVLVASTAPMTIDEACSYYLARHSDTSGTPRGARPLSARPRAVTVTAIRYYVATAPAVPDAFDAVERDDFETAYLHERKNRLVFDHRTTLNQKISRLESELRLIEMAAAIPDHARVTEHAEESIRIAADSRLRAWRPGVMRRAALFRNRTDIADKLPRDPDRMSENNAPTTAIRLLIRSRLAVRRLAHTRTPLELSAVASSALEACLKEFGDNSLPVMDARFLLSQTHYALAQYADAVPLLEKCCEDYSDYLGADTFESINALAALSYCYAVTRNPKHDEAAVNTWHLAQMHLGPGTKVSLAALQKLAQLHENRLEFAEARICFDTGLAHCVDGSEMKMSFLVGAARTRRYEGNHEAAYHFGLLAADSYEENRSQFHPVTGIVAQRELVKAAGCLGKRRLTAQHAQAFVESARKTFAKSPIRLLHALVSVQKPLVLSQNMDLAEAYGKEARAMLNANTPILLKSNVYYQLARIHRLQGRLNESLQALKTESDLLNGKSPLYRQRDNFYQQGLALLQLRKREEARRKLSAALRLSEAPLSRLGGKPPLDSIPVVEAHRRILDAWLRSLDMESDTDAKLAFDHLNRSVGIIARSVQRRRVALRALARNETALSELEENTATTGREAIETGRVRGDAAWKLAARKSTLLRDVRRISAQTDVVERLDWHRLVEALSDDEAILQFFRMNDFRSISREPGTSGPYYLAAIVRKTDSAPALIRFSPKASEAIDQAAQQFADALSGAASIGRPRGAKSSSRVTVGSSAGTSLRKLLWNELRRHIVGCKQLIICADGPLRRLPWAALPSDRAGQYLIHHYRILTGDNPANLLNSTRMKREAAPRLLAVGDVSYDSAALGGPKSLASSHRIGTAVALPGTDEEVRSLAQLFPGAVIRTRDAARKQQILKDMSHAEFIHVATHGVTIREERLQQLYMQDPASEWAQRIHQFFVEPLAGPAILLAPPEPDAGSDTIRDEQAWDSYLTALEVSSIDLGHVQLATLSGCNTRSGQLLVNGEVEFGMQLGFRLAGVRSVVSSRWQVDDKTTCRFMEIFYRQVLKSPQTAPAEALQQTMIRMSKTHGPADWAGWCLTGDHV